MQKIRSVSIPIVVNLLFVGFQGHGNQLLNLTAEDLEPWFGHFTHNLPHLVAPVGDNPTTTHTFFTRESHVQYSFHFNIVKVSPLFATVLDDSLLWNARPEKPPRKSLREMDDDDLARLEAEETDQAPHGDLYYVDADRVSSLLHGLLDALGLGHGNNLFVLNPNAPVQRGPDDVPATYGYRSGFTAREQAGLRVSYLLDRGGFRGKLQQALAYFQQEDSVPWQRMRDATERKAQQELQQQQQQQLPPLSGTGGEWEGVSPPLPEWALPSAQGERWRVVDAEEASERFAAWYAEQLRQVKGVAQPYRYRPHPAHGETLQRLGRDSSLWALLTSVPRHRLPAEELALQLARNGTRFDRQQVRDVVRPDLWWLPEVEKVQQVGGSEEAPLLQLEQGWEEVWDDLDDFAEHLEQLERRQLSPRENCLVDAWVTHGRTAFLDLTAGPFHWGPLIQGEGARTHDTVPRVPLHQELISSWRERAAHAKEEAALQELRERQRQLEREFAGRCLESAVRREDMSPRCLALEEALRVTARELALRETPQEELEDDVAAAVAAAGGDEEEDERSRRLVHEVAGRHARRTDEDPRQQQQPQQQQQAGGGGGGGQEVAEEREGEGADHVMDSFLMELSAVLSTSLRHLYAPAVPLHPVRYHERVTFEIFLVADGALEASEQQVRQLGEESFRIEDLKEELSKLRLPEQEFSFVVRSVRLMDDPDLSAAFHQSLRTAVMPTLDPGGHFDTDDVVYIDSAELRSFLLHEEDDDDGHASGGGGGTTSDGRRRRQGGGRRRESGVAATAGGWWWGGSGSGIDATARGRMMQGEGEAGGEAMWQEGGRRRREAVERRRRELERAAHRHLPIFLFAASCGDKPLLVDKYYQAKGLSDMVVAVQSPFPQHPSRFGCNGRPITVDLRNPLKPLLAATALSLGGLISSHISYDEVHHHASQNWLWSVGDSVLSHTAAEPSFSQLQGDLVRRNYLAQSVDDAVERVNAAVQLLQRHPTTQGNKEAAEQLPFQQLLRHYFDVGSRFHAIAHDAIKLRFEAVPQHIKALEQAVQRLEQAAEQVDRILENFHCLPQAQHVSEDQDSVFLLLIPFLFFVFDFFLIVLLLLCRRPKKSKVKVN